MEASGLSKEAVIQRLLDVIENDIIPANTNAVKKGELMFGAAILKLSDMSLVCVGVNRGTESPLWHAEVACIQTFWELPAEERPRPSECLVLATHEPCSMCISAITWSSFPEVHFLFSMDDTLDVFNIPHDRRIFREVFQCEQATRQNAFWKAYDISKVNEAERLLEGIRHIQGQTCPMIEAIYLVVKTLPDAAEATKVKVNVLRATYASLFDTYQSSKDSGKSSVVVPGQV